MKMISVYMYMYILASGKQLSHTSSSLEIWCIFYFIFYLPLSSERKCLDLLLLCRQSHKQVLHCHHQNTREFRQESGSPATGSTGLSLNTRCSWTIFFSPFFLLIFSYSFSFFVFFLFFLLFPPSFYLFFALQNVFQRVRIHTVLA